MDYDTFKKKLAEPDFAKCLFIGFWLFVLSFFKSYAELRYHFGGQQTTARVVRVKNEPDYKHEKRDLGHRVTFEFHNASSGNLQQGFSVVNEPEAKEYFKGKRVVVEYYDDTILGSRLAGESNWFWIYCFIGSMAVCIFCVVMLSLHSVYAERQLRKRKWWYR